MSGGGKGGSQSTAVQLPGFIEDAAKRAIARGDAASQIGYVPYSGPDVAAFTPLQEASFAATNQAAEAFGLPLAMGSNLPEAQDFGGVRGYSSKPIYDQALGVLATERPGQYGAINAQFIDPVTGAMSGGAAPSTPVGTTPTPVAYVDNGPAHFSTPSRPNAGGNAFGEYTSFRDMFDGGGPGKSGDKFEGGGLISDVANLSALRGIL